MKTERGSRIFDNEYISTAVTLDTENYEVLKFQTPKEISKTTDYNGLLGEKLLSLIARSSRVIMKNKDESFPSLCRFNFIGDRAGELPRPRSRGEILSDAEEFQFSEENYKTEFFVEKAEEFFEETLKIDEDSKISDKIGAIRDLKRKIFAEYQQELRDIREIRKSKGFDSEKVIVPSGEKILKDLACLEIEPEDLGKLLLEYRNRANNPGPDFKEINEPYSAGDYVIIVFANRGWGGARSLQLGVFEKDPSSSHVIKTSDGYWGFNVAQRQFGGFNARPYESVKHPNHRIVDALEKFFDSCDSETGGIPVALKCDILFKIAKELEIPFSMGRKEWMLFG